MTIKERVKSLPQTPGVYLMKDSNDTIIYVGKAKRLKNRVQTYFRNSIANSQKVEKLKKNICDFEYIQTDTEFEAFLLECQLIKRLKPFFNRKMKNPQSYAYIVIRDLNRIPYLDSAREFSEHDGNFYFGPFASKTSVEKSIQVLKEIFKIDCKNLTKRNGACLNYSLGSCFGICLGRRNEEKYNNIISKIIALLEGKDKSLINDLENQMEQAAEKMDFELAAKYLNYIERLNFILNKEEIIEFTKENKNIVVGEALDENNVKLFLIKGNKILFSTKYSFTNNKLVIKSLKEHIPLYFSSFKPITAISKEEIDEAQIIFKYINNSNYPYLLIADDLLENEEYLNRELNNFMPLLQNKKESYSG